jgi:hypothetical protein
MFSRRPEHGTHKSLDFNRIPQVPSVNLAALCAAEVQAHGGARKETCGMRPTKIYRSDDEAKRASSPGVLKPGWYPFRIIEAVERPDKNGRDMIELTGVVRTAHDAERQMRDWLIDHDKGALKLRHCCEAVGALDKYNAGEEISQDDFPGHDVQVKIVVEKRRGFPDQNRIQDYRPASAASVVNLTRAVAFLGGVSLAALTSACSTVPQGPSMPVRYNLAPTYYGYAVRRPYQPPQVYAANDRIPAPDRVPVPPPPPHSSQDLLAPYAEGAAVGAIGGVMAGRAMAAKEVGEQTTKGALSSEARVIAAKEAETAMTRTAITRAGTVGASEALTAGRVAGAAGAGAAAGTAETAGGAAVIGRALMWTVKKSWIGFALVPVAEYFLSERKN